MAPSSRVARRVGAALCLGLVATGASAQEGRIVLEDLGAGGSPSFGNANGGYGAAVCAVGDIDLDGRADIAVGQPQWLTGGAGSGRVRLVSGLDGSTLRDITSGQSGVGTALAAPGDVDGDSVPDVLSLDAGGNVQLFSGANGSVLLSLPVGASAIAAPGDWNNDGVPDLAYMQSGNVRVVSGANGLLLTVVGSGPYAKFVDLGPLPGAAPSLAPRPLATQVNNSVSLFAPGGAFLWSVSGYQDVANGGDVNGDLVHDVVAIAQGGFAVDVLSGVDGSVLTTVPGGAIAAGGADIDGDGRDDIVVGDPSGRGRIRVSSGASGALLYEREGEEFGEGFGTAVAMHPGAGPLAREAALVGAPYRFDGSVEVGAVQAIAQALPGELDGSFRPFGPTCNYTSTRLRPGAGRPTVGQTYTFRYDNNSGNGGFELLVLGLSNTSSNGVPLPVVVLPVGLSCQLYVSLDAIQTASFLGPWESIPIPPTPTLAGFTMFVQAWKISGWPVLEATDAATFLVGN